MESVLITGGNGSIGLACGRLFLERWPEARVYLGCREARAQAEAMAAECPGRVHPVELEVTREEDWTRVVTTVLEECGRMDVQIGRAHV